jgi:LysR substrate binding domain.
MRANVKVPLNTVNTMSMQTFLQIIQTAPMVAMLPEAMVTQQVKEGKLCILETELILDAQDYGILTRKDEPVSEIAQTFIEILLENTK